MSAPNCFSLSAGLILAFSQVTALPDQNVKILDVPDYSWYAGCFGSASGNLMGFWDRNGFPDMYTGPTANGVAPLNSNGSNVGIRSLWASKAGFDGRPADQPGHTDDYWTYFYSDTSYSYESAGPDPYSVAGRPEHAPDCTGDFMGASQNKWKDLNGECNGNIDAFSFNFWDKTGARRFNFTPPNQDGVEVRDIQSGFRKFAAWRGYGTETYSQLVDFDTNIPAGIGFTFEDLKAEIDAGYPVMLFLQNPQYYSRNVGGMNNANPIVHGMIAYGYVETATSKQVRYRTSWASGDNRFAEWAGGVWEASLTLRGVIAFHPQPKIRSVTAQADGVHVQWDGPSAQVYDNLAKTTNAVHWYVIEKLDSLNSANFTPITTPSTTREAVLDPATLGSQEYFRVKLLAPAEIPH
jgi:hypothetical protein